MASRFDSLALLQGLRHLTLRLPDDLEPRAALAALQVQLGAGKVGHGGVWVGD